MDSSSSSFNNTRYNTQPPAHPRSRLKGTSGGGGAQHQQPDMESIYTEEGGSSAGHVDDHSPQSINSASSSGGGSTGSSPMSQSSAGRRRARATQSRIKRYGGGGTESISSSGSSPPRQPKSSNSSSPESGSSNNHNADESHASSAGWSTGDEDSRESTHYQQNQSTSPPPPVLSAKNPQEDYYHNSNNSGDSHDMNIKGAAGDDSERSQDSSHVNYLSLAAGMGPDTVINLDDKERSFTSDDYGEDGSYGGSTTTEDSEEAYLKETTKRYDKYRDLLTNERTAKSPWMSASGRKLGAPPSLALSPSDSDTSLRKRLDSSGSGGMFGGASKLPSAASGLGYDPTSLEEQKKAKKARHNVPLPESSILDKEDMATLKMMLSLGDSDDSSSETNSGGVISLSSSHDNAKPFVDDNSSDAGNDGGDVSYFSASQTPSAAQADLSYQSSSRDGENASQKSFIFDQPESDEGSYAEDLIMDHDVLIMDTQQAIDDDRGDKRLAAGVVAAGAATAGAAVGIHHLNEEDSSNQDHNDNEPTQMVELHHVEPQKKATMAPVPPAASTVDLRHVETNEDHHPHEEPKLVEEVHLHHVEPKQKEQGHQQQGIDRGAVVGDENSMSEEDEKEEDKGAMRQAAGALAAGAAVAGAAVGLHHLHDSDSGADEPTQLKSTAKEDPLDDNSMSEEDEKEEDKGVMRKAAGALVAGAAVAGTAVGLHHLHDSDSGADKPEEDSSDFMDSEVIPHKPQETRMSRYAAPGAGAHKTGTAYNFDDDDDDDDFAGGDESFSDIWEQSVTAETKPNAPAIPAVRAQSVEEENEPVADRPNRVFATRHDGSIIEREPSGRWAEAKKTDSEGKLDEDESEEDLDAYFSGLKRESSMKRENSMRGKKAGAAAAGVGAGAALASTAQKTPTIDENAELSVAAEGSISAFDFPNQSDRDDSEMDSYSLGASKDIVALASATSAIDKKEYEPKSEEDPDASMSFDEAIGAAASTDKSEKDGEKTSDKEGKPEKSSKDPKRRSSRRKKKKAGPPTKVPPFWSGCRRNSIRLALLLALAAAIVLPIYFFVIDTDSSDPELERSSSVQLFGPLDTPAPTDFPAPTISPTPRPTRAPTPNAGIPIPPSQIAPVGPPSSASGAPSMDQTSSPTEPPSTDAPTAQPIQSTPVPTASNTGVPTASPITQSPTEVPTASSTEAPTASPILPTSVPTTTRTSSPTSSQTEPIFEVVKSLLVAIDPTLEASLNDPSSDSYESLQWLSEDPSVLSYSESKIIQRFALALFFLSTDGNAWTRSDNWFTYTDECQWYTTSTGNQSCNPDGIFVNLELELNNIGGTLPDQISLLSSLQRFDLTRNGSQNAVAGELPDGVGSLANLQELSLAGNQLSGRLPETLGQMSSLQVLDLQNNLLTGSIPSSVGFLSELTTIELTNNRLSEFLPTNLGRLTKMKRLFLADNNFSGPIPSELGTMFLLETMNLDGNQLTFLPSELGNLIFLRSMSIARNELEGPIPDQLGNLVNILTLDLKENELSGTIPTQLGGLVLIRGKLWFQLFHNCCPRFFSLFPLTPVVFVLLDNLDLSNNVLSGLIPSELGQLVFLSKFSVPYGRISLAT